VERREGGREGGREGRRGKSRQEKKDGIESKQGEGGREGRTYLRVGQNQLMSTRNEWREGGREEGREGGREGGRDVPEGRAGSIEDGDNAEGVGEGTAVAGGGNLREGGRKGEMSKRSNSRKTTHIGSIHSNPPSLPPSLPSFPWQSLWWPLPPLLPRKLLHPIQVPVRRYRNK